MVLEASTPFGVGTWRVLDGGSPSTLLGPETTGRPAPHECCEQWVVECFWIEYGSRGSCHTRSRWLVFGLARLLGVVVRVCLVGSSVA